VAVKVAILDDWFDTLRTLACFEKLAGHTVTVFTDHVQDTGLLTERLAGFDALVPFASGPRSAPRCRSEHPLSQAGIGLSRT